MVPNLNLSFVQNTIEDLIYAFGKYWNLWNGQILQAFSWFKTNGWKDPLNFYFSVNLNKIFALFIYKKKFYKMFTSKPDQMICLLCVYICHYIFPFYYLDISFFIFTHWDRKYYYIKVLESILFVCTGNSGISRVLCNANTYWSIHEGLFFNFSPALGLKYPLRLPYMIYSFLFLFASFTI